MYVSNNLGSYGGLESAWGETAKAKAKAKAKPEVAKIKAKTKAASLETELKQIEEELPTPPTSSALKNPEDFIPKPSESIGANEAMLLLTRPQGARGGQASKLKGKVYWSAMGPQFSQKKIAGGGVAEDVPPPVIKLRPNVRVVRDMPMLKTLAPVQTTAPAPAPALQGFGESKAVNWVSIAVLGFVFLALFGYNQQ